MADEELLEGKFIPKKVPTKIAGEGIPPGEVLPQNEIPIAPLNDLMKPERMIVSEDALKGKDAEDGIIFRDGMLLVDTQKATENEKQLIGDFSAAVQNGSWNRSRFAWYFEEEGEEFVRALEGYLREEDEGLRSLKLASIVEDEMREKIQSAAASFRDMAHNEQIRKALKKQVQRIPISSFVGYSKARDQEFEIQFNPNVDDPNNAVEFLYVNNENGEPELLVASKNDDVEIRGIVFQEQTSWKDGGKFRVNVNPKQTDTQFDEIDFSHYDISVEQGDSSVTPIFSHVRILMKPVDLQEQVRMMVEQEDAIRKQPVYAPSPQSVPSAPKSRWQQPTTYVSVSSSH